MKAYAMGLALLAASGVDDCDPPTTPTADQRQSAIQAKQLEQAHAQVGMPSIQNWQEKRMAKDIYELRDKSIATHAYMVNEMAGCLIYLGPAVGYGLPYATQYTSPTRPDWYDNVHGAGYTQTPQAEPNGLFMPSAAEGTWVLLKDPNSDAVKPVYIEPRVLVSPFRLETQECKPVQAVKR